jgi:hypothetical protein
MIMYSIVSNEQIFEGIDNEQTEIEEVNIDGVMMQVQAINSRQAKIIRLISPNPQDYLNPSFMPGQLIHYKPSTSIN